jgi:hypothetical protein
MTKLLEKAGLVAGSTIAAFAVSAVAMADSALAFTFYPLDLSGLQNLQTAGVAPGTELLGPTNYFGDRLNDGTKNKLGTFTVTLINQMNAVLTRPAGSAEGDLVLGVKRSPVGGFITIQIDFTPNNGKSSLLPGIKVRQLNPTADGSSGPATLDPFADPTDDFSEVALDDGVNWVGGSVDPRFDGGAVDNILSWTYDTVPSETPSSEIPFIFTSGEGTTSSVLITYKSGGTFVNNGGFNISTAYVPTPALLPGLIGLGVAALRKRNEEEADQA